MPWNEVRPMDERIRFALALNSGLYTMTELCERHGISRKTGHKWADRYHRKGLEGLAERSRAPHTCPHKTPLQVENLITEKRKQKGWGPLKIRHHLARTHPELPLPAESTIGDILRRAGLVTPKRTRKKRAHPTARKLSVSSPNQVWTMDFKGEFRLGNSRYCYPLTVEDAHSRFLLCCHGLNSTAQTGVRPVLDRLFRERGLPNAIRTDNGSPFASTGHLGLTRLSVWWLKLGIAHQRISPGQPWQNGRHERMHRTLKKAATIPPESNLKAQQDRFDRFVHEYNMERPHQSLDGDVPASQYKPSSRAMPKRIEKPDYPGHFEVRKVSSSGTIKLRGRIPFIGAALVHEYVGLEEIDAGIWNVIFYDTLLARFDENNLKLT